VGSYHRPDPIAEGTSRDRCVGLDEGHGLISPAGPEGTGGGVDEDPAGGSGCGRVGRTLHGGVGSALIAATAASYDGEDRPHPAHSAVSIAAAAHERHQAGPGSYDPPHGGRTHHAGEDEVTVARPLILALRGGGHEVRWVRAVRELRTELPAFSPQVLLLDVNLDTDGLEYLQAIRFTELCPPAEWWCWLIPATPPRATALFSSEPPPSSPSRWRRLSCWRWSRSWSASSRRTAGSGRFGEGFWLRPLRDVDPADGDVGDESGDHDRQAHADPFPAPS